MFVLYLVKQIKEMKITLDKAKQELQTLLIKSDSMSSSFHMGRVGFRKDTKKVSNQIDRSVKDAIRITELSNFIQSEEQKVETNKFISKYYSSTSELTKGNTYIDIDYGVVEVVKINKNTVTIKTKSGYTEARKPSFILLNK